MINLRYHIVSITAVFLALAIGLALGSTLIQRGIVDTLETRLDELGERLDRTDGENSALREHLEERDDFDRRLNLGRLPLLAGHLAERSTLVLAAQGTDDASLNAVRESLQAAGSTVSGTLMFTARWDRLTAEEIEELALLLGQRVPDDVAARRLTLRRLAEELNDAAGPPPIPDPPPETDDDELDGAEGLEGLEGLGIEEIDDAAGQNSSLGVPAQIDPPSTDGSTPGDPEGSPPGDPEGDPGPETEEPLPDPVPESDLIENLVILGYLEFFPESAASPLPTFEMSYVFIADDDAVVDDQTLAVPLLESLVGLADGPAPIVVAGAQGPAPDPGTPSDDEDPAERLASLVRLIRLDEDLRLGVSTVDSLNTFEGQAAVVLAISHLAQAPAGHYGRGVGAEALWPAAP